jgi:hypothetical protein
MENFSKSQLERLSFIDFRLYFAGQISRDDLRKRFGIKDAAATRDLTLYREHAPKNIQYDPTLKVYRIAEAYKRHFIKDVQVKDLIIGLVHGVGDDLTSSPPTPVVSCEVPSRLYIPHIEKFACASRAIYNKKALKIRYLSESSGQTERTIIPFCFAGNGLRWHIRAFDRKRQLFGDFVVNRIMDAKILPNEVIEAHETLQQDSQWNTAVDLEIVPHPTLKDSEFIEYEYDMHDGVLKHTVSAAMAAYILRLWNVDCSTEKPTANANHFQLWLRNAGEVSKKASLHIAPNF